MIAKIENNLPGSASIQALRELNSILGIITAAKDGDELQNDIMSFNYDCFIYGFGSSHFWLKHRGRNFKISERILIVEF